MIALPSTARLIAYGVAGAVLAGGVAWAIHDVRSAYRARAALPLARAERDAAVATVKLAGEEAARNARIANDYHDQIDRLRADLRDRPIVLRVCPRAPVRPAAPSGSAPRADAPATGPVAGTVETDSEPLDVTVELSAYAEDCAVAGITLSALQRWVRERP